MKKIMFNDKSGLTQAVLEGRKTQTRRIAYDFRKHTSNKVTKCVILPSGSITYMDGKIQVLDDMPNPAYKIGEEVAVAQPYNDTWQHTGYMTAFEAKHCPGYNNKMFVRANLMPHRIKITNIRVERLQDISEEDCLNEGVEKLKWEHSNEFYYMTKATPHRYNLAKYAFASLIDKTSGRGTWDSNPWVFVYDFKLIK